MRARLFTPVVVLGWAFAAGCDAGSAGPKGYEIQVSPLELPDISDACYGITVYNSETEFSSATTVWSQDEICATQYGDGSGSITYVGTCDADADNNTVELRLEGLWSGGAHDDVDSEQLGGDDFENPCTSLDAEHTCRLVRPCDENTDTLVAFNITVMRAAKQGFFDIAVDFEDIFCSAKADCVGDLLFNGEDRDNTAVLAFACSGGQDVDTHLYMSDTYIVCDDTTNTTNMTTEPGWQVVAKLKPSAGPGNVASPVADQGLFGYAVYEGREDRDDNNVAFSNMAIGFEDEFFYGCPAGFMHQAGACVSCPGGRNAIGGQCGFCPAGSTYDNEQCMGCLNEQRYFADLDLCGGMDGLGHQPGWTQPDVFAPTDVVPATTVPLDRTNPRQCYAYAWATASDEVWPTLSTPAGTTYPVVRYRVPLNPSPTPEDDNATTLSCGQNALDESSVVETQYTNVGSSACFDNLLSSDWSIDTNEVDSDHYTQHSWFFDAMGFITNLPERVPPCEVVWPLPGYKDAGPVNHEEPAQDVKVYAFNDLDSDGVRDAGEPLLGDFQFALAAQAYLPWSAMLEGGTSGVRFKSTTASGPAVFSSTAVGNYMVTAFGGAGMGSCANLTWTSPKSSTWGSVFTYSTKIVVGGAVPFDGLYVGVHCN